MEMPSLTPIVLKRIPTQPLSLTPCFTCSASVFRCMLQGFPSYHTLAMPTCGLLRSSADNPVASSIACDAPCTAGCVMREEKRLGTDFVCAAVVVMSSPSVLCAGQNRSLRFSFLQRTAPGAQDPTPHAQLH